MISSKEVRPGVVGTVRESVETHLTVRFYLHSVCMSELHKAAERKKLTKEVKDDTLILSDPSPRNMNTMWPSVLLFYRGVCMNRARGRWWTCFVFGLPVDAFTRLLPGDTVLEEGRGRRQRGGDVWRQQWDKKELRFSQAGAFRRIRTALFIQNSDL